MTEASFPYLSPVIDVTLSGKGVGPLTARFGVTSDLRGKADTCVLMAAGWYTFSLTNMDASPAQVVLPGMLIQFGMMLVFPLLSTIISLSNS